MYNFRYRTTYKIQNTQIYRIERPASTWHCNERADGSELLIRQICIQWNAKLQSSSAVLAKCNHQINATQINARGGGCYRGLPAKLNGTSCGTTALIVAGYFSWKPDFSHQLFHMEARLVHLKDKSFHMEPRSP